MIAEPWPILRSRAIGRQGGKLTDIQSLRAPVATAMLPPACGATGALAGHEKSSSPSTAGRRERSAARSRRRCCCGRIKSSSDRTLRAIGAQQCSSRGAVRATRDRLVMGNRRIRSSPRSDDSGDHEPDQERYAKALADHDYLLRGPCASCDVCARLWSARNSGHLINTIRAGSGILPLRGRGSPDSSPEASYSGAAGVRTFASKKARPGSVDDLFLERLARSKGRAIIASSRPSEASIAGADLWHGFFTYYLLEGLKGAAGLNRDGIVSLQELYEYVEQQVVRKSRAVGGNQHPMMQGELVVVLLLLASVGTASAECGWVLWLKTHSNRSSSASASPRCRRAARRLSHRGSTWK